MSLKPFDFLRVRPNQRIDLDRIDPGATRGVPQDPLPAIDNNTLQLGMLQERLYAEGRRSLLVVLQGLDASGKDGTIRHVFDEVNPTGVQVTSFKQPSAEELRHDFLWRCHAKAPAHGYLSVFNRSHYEDVLVVRVHADTLLPRELRAKAAEEWPRRFRMIRDFERMLSECGTRVVKFFLHISKDEQRKRFIKRQQNPDKNWKLAAGDFEERKLWKQYRAAYEDALPATSTDAAPWYIIPADQKKARDFYISGILARVLEEMDPRPPKLEDASLAKLKFK